MILQIKNLSKNFGDNVVFKDAQLKINDNERVALIGQNGTGKSTLIKCISGDEHYLGSIVFEANLKISVMEQEKRFKKHETTFRKYVEAKRAKVVERLAELEDQMGDPAIYENLASYEKIIAEYEKLCTRVTEAMEFEKLKGILDSLGFSLGLLDQPINTLSGGEITALRLAECLGRKADLLILDEPTNHLDVRAIEWLQDWLINSGKTVMIISHDRYFIDKVANKIVETENNELISYNTNYSGYILDRASYRAAMKEKYQAVTKEKDRLLDSMDQKRVWAHKYGNRHMKIIADKLERRAEELPDVIDPETLEKKYDLKCKTGIFSSYRVFDLENISKNFGSKMLFENVSLSITRKDRIAILGDNGSGKTTVMKILLGIEEFSGQVIKGENLKIGYFDQDGKSLSGSMKVRDYFADKFAHIHDNQIVNLAKRLGLDYDYQKKKIKELSPGERARMQLVGILLAGYNVLLLDEPTNHLDLELREALERALMEFEGAIVFVSHDRYFAKKIANKIWQLEDGKISELDVECSGS